MDVKIIVASHKNCDLPKDSMYVPVQVGSAGKEKIAGFRHDDEGDNISLLNPYYSELTGLYWAWKNLDADYIGLVHYRRYFAKTAFFSLFQKQTFDNVLSSEDVIDLINGTKVILPKKRNYYIESLYKHYGHTLNIEDLEVTEAVISSHFPEYLSSFQRIKTRTSAHMFNMMVMEKEILNQYCLWLFDILDRVTEIRGYDFDAFHNRYPGRVSELLLDVWIETNNIVYKEQPLIFIGGKKLIRKGIGLVSSKLRDRKYRKSM